jgi:hypothetical protein
MPETNVAGRYEGRDPTGTILRRLSRVTIGWPVRRS